LSSERPKHDNNGSPDRSVGHFRRAEVDWPTEVSGEPRQLASRGAAAPGGSP